MFVQVIEGRTSDRKGMKRLGQKWQAELRPGAVGFLGVTAGAAADGRTISIVRFESEEAARKNSERPEQTAFFQEMQELLDGEPTFTESTDVAEFLGGGSDDAEFVQVMKVKGVDRARIERLDESFEKFAGQRPDLLGGFRVWTGADSYIEVGYFTNEEEARKGERRELPDELKPLMAEFDDINANTEFIDLTDPQIY